MLSIDLIVRTAVCIFGSATVIRDFTPLNSCRCSSSIVHIYSPFLTPYLEIPLLSIYFTWTGKCLPFLPHQTIITNHIPFETLSSSKLKTIWNQNLSPEAIFYRPRNILPQGISPFFYPRVFFVIYGIFGWQSGAWFDRSICISIDWYHLNKRNEGVKS